MDEIKNALWTSTPDWECPNCRAVNAGHREHCRICLYDSNCGEFPWYNPLPPWDGLPKDAEIFPRPTGRQRA